MQDTSKIVELILSFNTAATQEMALIKSANPLTLPFLHEHLYNFVLAKFMMTKDDCPNDNFTDIANASLAKSMKISPELVKEFDNAKSCSGTSSVMAKKVLLFLKIQKELDIILPAERSAKIKTMSDLSDMVWDTLQEQHTKGGKI